MRGLDLPALRIVFAACSSCSSLFHASCSTGNHSSAISKLRSALAKAPCVSRFLRFAPLSVANCLWNTARSIGFDNCRISSELAAVFRRLNKSVSALSEVSTAADSSGPLRLPVFWPVFFLAIVHHTCGSIGLPTGLIYGLKNSGPRRSAFEISNKSAARIKEGTTSAKRDLMQEELLLLRTRNPWAGFWAIM